MSLSVCIVSYNTRALLDRCLASVERAGADEILVTDNASSDDSAALVQSNYPRVQLAINHANLNYTRAMNQTLARARGDMLLLLNPDTELQPGALNVLANALAQYPQWGAVGARLEFPDGSLQRTGNRLPTARFLLYEAAGINARMPTNAERQRNIYADWDRGDTRAVEAVSGACLLVRHAVVEQVGLLDEAFPMYFEEVDWCARMGAAGWGVGYVAAARVTHHAEASARQVSDARRNEFFETGLTQYAYKYYGARFGAAVRGLLAVRRARRNAAAGIEGAPGAGA